MLFIIAILLFTSGLMNDSLEDTPLKSSFDLQIFQEPRPIVINGKPALVYELHLTNFAKDVLTLKCVSVLDASSEAKLMNVCDDVLSGRIGLTATDKRAIQPGMHAVVYLEIEITANTNAIKHQIQYEDLKNSEPDVLEGAHISLQKNPPLILNPPLADGPWAAIYDPSWERGHRRVFYAVDGKARLPGRFAIDFIKLDEQGRFAANDNDQVSNWHGYGADVLAVGNARVAATRDNMKESATVSAHSKQKLEDASGNYIALDLGNGYFAFYEHLKPGSIRVKPGDTVQSGQVIASLGFTGDSTGPHLHFHVADRNSPLAEGVPYALNSFSVIGSYTTLDKFGEEPWKNSTPSPRNFEFPASKVVVMFD